MKETFRVIIDFVVKNFRKIWYAGMVLVASIYITNYRFDIFDLDENNAYNFIFYLWLLLLFFPLLSEMEFFGFKIKKEVQGVKQEVQTASEAIKGAIQEVHTSITTNQSTANINIVNPSPVDKLSEMLQRAGIRDNYNGNGTNANYDNYPPAEEMSKPIGQHRVPYQNNSYRPASTSVELDEDKIDLLFWERYRLEKAVRSLCAKTECARNLTFYDMITYLNNKGYIDYDHFLIIREVYIIETWAIHGLAIKNEHYTFVFNVKSKIESILHKASEQINDERDRII